MMITAQDALEIIENCSEDFGIESVPFLKSQGRVLKEIIYADRDFPPFNRVSMDGIAISNQAFLNGKRTFFIEGVQAAGSAQLTLQNAVNCLEVMTGAVLPHNCNVVIPYELITIENGSATVNISEVNYFQNIHKKAKDKSKGDVLILENTIITAAEIGVLASVGKFEVMVAKNPKVMIISTGDELVEVSENPLEHQIRRSNVFSLAALLIDLNLEAETSHLPDDKAALKKEIARLLTDYDVLLFSGAVSKGKFDFIPEVLDELGVEKLFHQVKQRPGKPFWFGRKMASKITSEGIEKNTTIFAFPGNPVSTYVNCLKYFYPWFLKSVTGVSPKLGCAKLTTDFEFKPSLTYFLQVALENKNAEIWATPLMGNGSGDFANLVEAAAFIELPDDRSEFKKGETFPILSYRSY